MPENNYQRVERSFTQTIEAAPEKVFELICPVREREWLDGWDCEIIFSRSGLAEQDAVFRSVDPDGGEVLWLISRHDRENFFVELLRISPASRLGKVRVQLAPCGAEQTAATITYQFTALSEAGNQFVANFTEEHYHAFMGWWEKSMNHYLKTGRRLPKADAAEKEER